MEDKPMTSNFLSKLPKQGIRMAFLIASIGIAGLATAQAKSPDTISQTQAIPSQAHFPVVPRIVEHKNASDTSAEADPTIYWSNSRIKTLLQPMAIPVPAYSTTGYYSQGYIFIDVLDPDGWIQINEEQPNPVYAATFMSNDFHRHYVIGSSASGNDITLPFHNFGWIDTTTGDFTSLGTLSGDLPADIWNSMKWDHQSETLFAVGDNTTLYRIDPVTLVSSRIGAIAGAGVNPDRVVVAMAISPDGLMYAIDVVDDVLLAVDKNTAEAAVIGPLGINANFAQDMDFDHTDGTLYWAAYLGGGDCRMTTIDLDTGTANFLGSIPGGIELLSFSIAKLNEEPDPNLIFADGFEN